MAVAIFLQHNQICNCPLIKDLSIVVILPLLRRGVGFVRAHVKFSMVYLMHIQTNYYCFFLNKLTPAVATDLGQPWLEAGLLPNHGPGGVRTTIAANIITFEI